LAQPLGLVAAVALENMLEIVAHHLVEVEL
jgi:hypothetical protein